MILASPGDVTNHTHMDDVGTETTVRFLTHLGDMSGEAVADVAAVVSILADGHHLSGQGVR